MADLGCGTGSLAILAAELGHDVDGIDFSEQMLSVARTKARGLTGVRFNPGNAEAPRLAEGAFDTVLCRHVLWALPDPGRHFSAGPGSCVPRDGWSSSRAGGRQVLVCQASRSWTSLVGRASQRRSSRSPTQATGVPPSMMIATGCLRRGRVDEG